MYLEITSQQFSNTAVPTILERLSSVFEHIGMDFYVIGATARDILLMCMANVKAMRQTRDIDIAIAISDWSKYETVASAMADAGFEKSQTQFQRFHIDGYEVDVVPFGGIAHNDQCIYWPPHDDIAMSVKSYPEVLSHAVTILIDNMLSIKLVSLHGLFLFKFNAWYDRQLWTTKDADDMWQIIEHYYQANEGINQHYEVYDLDNFDFHFAGAYWLAHDIADLLEPSQLYEYWSMLANVLTDDADSRIISHILSSNPTLSIQTVMSAFNTILSVWKQRITL